MKKSFIVFIIFALIGIAAYLFYHEGTLPVNKTDTNTKTFTVKKGENLDTVINGLAKEGLIRNRVIFYLVVKKLGIERKIQAGDFRLKPSLNAYQIADALTHGTEDIWVTIPEGLRKEEIAAILSKDLDISEIEFIEAAEEGYLYPETYLVPKGASVQAILDLMKKTYEEKYTPEMRAKAKQLGLSDKEVVILASLVEREARHDEDRQKIASVFLKRIDEDMPLQVDATVQYAMGYNKIQKRWWKQNLLFDDLKIDSPYNTYQNAGLPPAPIANPGIESIEAVVNADPETPYIFYLSDKSGTTHYAKTLDEHNRNIEKYLD